ncbi:2229_t:CDS:2, partial [Funneliformis geosporum]
VFKNTNWNKKEKFTTELKIKSDREIDILEGYLEVDLDDILNEKDLENNEEKYSPYKIDKILRSTYYNKWEPKSLLDKENTPVLVYLSEEIVLNLERDLKENLMEC